MNKEKGQIKSGRVDQKKNSKTVQNEETETRKNTNTITRQNVKRGRVKMGGTLTMDREVIGIRDLRRNLADVWDKITGHVGAVVTAEDKVRNGRMATIISTEMLKELMEVYEFTSEIGWDEPTQQFYAMVNEIQVDGIGDSQGEAIEMAVENAEMAAENFFEKIDMYMSASRFKKMYPYYLKVMLARSLEIPLNTVLGFEE